MLLVIPELLPADEVAYLRNRLAHAAWSNVNETAGTQSAAVKRNQQLPEHDATARAGSHLALQALSRNATFMSAALPKTIYPPLFNRYAGERNHFGDHIDNAIRTHVDQDAKRVQNIRTDLSATLFLSSPDEYDGGELVMQTTFGEQRVKPAAGDMVLYSASTVHRVEQVTRGARIASFFWIESMVRRDDQRTLLFNMDQSIASLRSKHGETAEAIALTGTYHNLLRMWGET
jgi:PKHD-type hydroxylase